MRSASALSIATALLTLYCTTALAKEAPPEQASPPTVNAQPIGGGKPVSTTVIKRCPTGWELVLRVNGSYGCAKDIIPPSDN